MKYQELLKECDTGTIVFDGSGNARDKDGHTVAINARGGNDKRWKEQGHLRVKLLAHSTNVLPQALEALKTALKYGDLDTAEHQIVGEAIAAIENVNV